MKRKYKRLKVQKICKNYESTWRSLPQEKPITTYISGNAAFN
jgi:hypothetical protein